MYFNSGGYSSIQYNCAELRACAKRIAEALPGIMAETGAQAVAVTGKSGLSLAFATLMLIDFNLIVVRKRGENSHGASVEGTPNADITRYLVLDDFIDSGATIESIQNSLSMYAGASNLELAGVVLYRNFQVAKVEERSLGGKYVPVYTL